FARRERVARRMQGKAQVKIVGVIGDVHRGVINGIRRVRHVLKRRRYACPVVERAVDCNVLEVPRGSAEREDRDQSNAAGEKSWSLHRVHIKPLGSARSSSFLPSFLEITRWPRSP